MKFENLEAAQEAYTKLEQSFKDYKTAVDKQLSDKDKALKDAEEVAQDAISKFNQKSGSLDLTVKVEKFTYKVNFGVGGKSKEEVADDQVLLKNLVKIGSGALTKIEG